MDQRIKCLEKVKCFILDMDGTIYLGERLLPGADRFISCLQAKGMDYYFYTNNSSENVQAYQQKLQRLNMPTPKEKIMISNAVIIRYLQKNMPEARVFLLGTPALKAEFEAAGIQLVEQDPTVVVVGFDTTLTYQRLAKACTFIRSGVPFYGINEDINCPIDGGYIPDCGSICTLITASTGVQPISFFGKPSRHTLQYILEVTGYREDQIAFVGDRLYTDIAVTKATAAQSFMVLTGEGTEADIKKFQITPDAVFSSVDEIRQVLETM